jgi:hypothetical protein
MKRMGFFEIRDNLIFRILRSPHDSAESASMEPLNETRADFINTFSFESVADQKAFRENNGILYLFQIFHDTTDPALQVLYILTASHLILNTEHHL